MFKEINYVLETHTYKINIDNVADVYNKTMSSVWHESNVIELASGWFMRVEKVHEVNENNGLEWDCWMGYIYRAGYDPMFVIGENVEQHLLKDKGALSIVTLDDFLDTMYYCLFEEDSVESPFEQFDRQIEAIEQSNEEMLEANDLI